MLDAFPIDRSSTTDKVVTALRDQLFEGRLSPGTPLREAELATAFGVGRSTVREALRTLVAENLLTRLPNRGVVVRGLDPAELEDLQRARHVLEAGAVSSARAEHLPALGAALAAYEAAVSSGRPELVNAAHIGFHQALVGLAGSQRLSELEATLLNDLRLALAVAEREADDTEEQLAAHRQLHALVAGGDTAAALAELAVHLHQHEDAPA
ncbi:MAG: GntR family transcriptional regulator [Acidimicrobiia bacterium]|nr:GntR family transcriptional regulator [Acidimicrobiia bacterium]